jgi:hypothetical protein
LWFGLHLKKKQVKRKRKRHVAQWEKDLQYLRRLTFGCELGGLSDTFGGGFGGVGDT